jgi:hypothetical protein
VVVSGMEKTSVFNLSLESGMELALAEISTKVTRRGLIALKEFPDEGLLIALPYNDKIGHA